MKRRKPLVIARTGDIEKAPENTLPAFESAISRGADGVEFDVHLTSDGKLVVHHFHNLGTTDNGEGLVSEHTLAELKALDSGAWFDKGFVGESKPTLSEVLELCKGRVKPEADLKDSSVVFLRKVVREIEKVRPDRRCGANNVSLSTADARERAQPWTAHRDFLRQASRLDAHSPRPETCIRLGQSTRRRCCPSEHRADYHRLREEPASKWLHRARVESGFGRRDPAGSVSRHRLILNRSSRGGSATAG